MKVEIWSDFVCPFCYMGKRHFEQALEQWPDKDKVEIIYRSFELDPSAPRNTGKSLHSVLAEKFGITVERARAMNADVARRAKAVGLDYHMDTIIPTNTFDAHRLMHFAAGKHRSVEMVERLFRAYFTDCKDIGDRDTLAELAGEVGLPQADVRDMLERGDYTREVRQDEREGQALGIHGVPCFVVDRVVAVSGAQPVEVFLDAFRRAEAAHQ
ncbi:DSBA oxidoreductase [Alicyclobacillus contaminans]|uniref:DsbA family oxidoreductase n=1 Tax=Alicyclobacillus contaminans TaxID=392016 RepID=UPI00040DBBE8|nr:DsbA family oxidoreductase [Alicyclobacillus contaminans]GMA49686.1 DSBA oxidoreductase [Alicyclobacillus contaminans]